MKLVSTRLAPTIMLPENRVCNERLVGGRSCQKYSVHDYDNHSKIYKNSSEADKWQYYELESNMGEEHAVNIT